MKNRIGLSLILGLLFFYNAKSFAENKRTANILSQIYSEREYIITKYLDYDSLKSREKFSSNIFKNKVMFVSYYNQSFANWENHENEILDIFFSFCGQNRKYSKTQNNYLLNDRIIIKILFSFLNSDKENLKKYYIPVFTLLLNETSYSLLKENSTQLKSILNRNHYLLIPNDQKIKLLGLLDLTINEKDSLLSLKELPLAIRTRLGDSVAENELINLYIKEKEFWKKEEYVKDLLYAGTRKIFQTLILHFNEPIFDIIKASPNSEPCISRSIRFSILIGLRNYYPDLPLLKDDLEQFWNPPFMIPGYREKVTEYLNNFKNWAFSTYGVHPIDPDPEPILRGFCKKYSLNP